jgi:hypothetical protein
MQSKLSYVIDDPKDPWDLALKCKTICSNL